MTLEQNYEKYRRRWSYQTKLEHMFMIIWHAIVNFIHCFPLLITGHKIVAHSTKLEENGFTLTKSEEDSLANVKTLMIMSPIIVALIVPSIQWATLILYYKYGHPWCRIFKHFKKPEERKSSVVSENNSSVPV